MEVNKKKENKNENIKLSIFETHAHLDFFSNEKTFNQCVLKKLIVDCKKNGISKFVIPPISFESNFRIAQIIKEFNQNSQKNKGMLYQAVGLHPREAINVIYSKDKIEQLQQMCALEQVVAIKTGLDFCKTKLQQHQRQNEIVWFKENVKMASRLLMPLILHIREAFDDFRVAWKEVMEEIGRENLPVTVIHCFNSRDYNETLELINSGIAYFGIGNKIFTDPILRETVKHLKIENVVLESDSPFLRPEQYVPPQYINDFISETSNKLKNPNTPLSLPIIAQEIANIKNMSIEEVIKKTTRNAEKLFKSIIWNRV